MARETQSRQAVIARGSDLKQSLRPSQIPQRSQISQRECEAILILIPYRAQREAAEFHAHAAAIPVIRGLRRGVLDEPQFRIEADIGRRTETLFPRVTVAQQKPKLVKELWPENHIPVRGCVEHTSTASTFPRNLQVGVAAAQRNRAELIISQNRARIDAAPREIVIDIPLEIGSRAGLNPQARD